MYMVIMKLNDTSKQAYDDTGMTVHLEMRCDTEE
jgi:hypothetical protein